MLGHIAADMATEASIKATQSPLRLFAFNLLSNNNWQNADFADLVSFAAYSIVLEMRRTGIPDPHQVLSHHLVDIYTLWLSEKLFQYPELKGVVPPNYVAATMNNLAFLNNRKQEIAMLRNQLGMGGEIATTYGQPIAPAYPQSGYPSQGYPQQPYNRPAAPPPYGQPMYGQPVQTHPGYGYPPPGGQAFGPGMGGPMMPPHQGPINRYAISQTTANIGTALPTGPTPSLGQPQRMAPPEQVGSLNQSAYFDRYADRLAANGSTVTTIEAPVVIPTVRTKYDWQPSMHQYYRQLIDTTRYYVEYQLFNNQTIEVIKPLESPMNRENHAITLLGHSYTLDGILRQEQVQNAGKDIAAINRQDLEAVINKEEVKNIDLIHQYVDTTWAVDAFLDDVIFRTKLDCRLHQAIKGRCSVYRSFATIAKPIVTSENYDNVFKELMDVRKLVDIGKKLKSIGTACNRVSIEADVSGREDMALYCHEIDVWLTELMNHFLMYNLSLGKVSIESFSDDIEELRTYLHDNFNVNYINAYDRFEDELLNTRKSSPLDDSAAAILRDSFGVKEEGVTASFIPINYSLTYVDLMSQELNVHLESDEALLIQSQQTPMLYELADSLFNQMDAWPYRTSRNLIITRDDKIYRLHKGYLGINSYLISL